MARVLKNSNKPCYYAFTLSDEVSEQAKLRSGELVSDAVAALLEQILVFSLIAQSQRL